MPETKPSVVPDVQLFADGACSGNPGPGGWAFILRHPASGKEIERSGGEPETTNNRMEMTAVIRGLEALKRPSSVEMVTDSTYVGKGVTEWMPKWKANGWRRREGSRGKPEPEGLTETLDRSHPDAPSRARLHAGDGDPADAASRGERVLGQGLLAPSPTNLLANRTVSHLIQSITCDTSAQFDGGFSGGKPDRPGMRVGRDLAVPLR
jgi:ribonuclease HI